MSGVRRIFLVPILRRPDSRTLVSLPQGTDVALNQREAPLEAAVFRANFRIDNFL